MATVHHYRLHYTIIQCLRLYIWPRQCCVLDDRCVAIAASEEVSADPHGLPSAPRHSRSSWMVAARLSSHEMSCRSSSSLPFFGQVNVDKPPRHTGSVQLCARSSTAATTLPWSAVLEALTELWNNVNKLKVESSVSSPTHTEVNSGAGTSTGEHQTRFLAYISGFLDSTS